VDGAVVVPAGSELEGRVRRARPSGTVRGRASLSLGFDRLLVGGTAHEIRSAPLVYEAAGTVGRDVATVGLPAAGGAIVGAVAGGKKGAAIGSVVGGSAGTAVVLSTSGDEIRLRAGTRLVARLETPIVVPTRTSATSSVSLLRRPGR
jgi:hypothetical protein